MLFNLYKTYHSAECMKNMQAQMVFWVQILDDSGC